VLAAFENLQTAAATQKVDSMKEAVRGVADAIRNFRLSLETAGTPPAPAVVEVGAVVESSKAYEAAARRFGECVGYGCLTLVRELNHAQASWMAAMTALTSKLRLS
jgi:hypothetical protein